MNKDKVIERLQAEIKEIEDKEFARHCRNIKWMHDKYEKKVKKFEKVIYRAVSGLKVLKNNSSLNKQQLDIVETILLELEGD